jgi:hypothetical protein
MQPEIVTNTVCNQALADVKAKKNLVLIDKIRFGSYAEGRLAQIMHVGPFSEEGSKIKRIHAYIIDLGGRPNGQHHEIYLADIRQVNPAKMTTLIRQPFGR